MKYINIIKQILDKDYGEERVFYNNDEWYDRDTCKNMSLYELESEVLGFVSRSEKDNEYIQQLTDKIYELMDEEKAEIFLETIER